VSRDSHASGVDVNGTTSRDASRDRPVDRVTVPEAAEMMGVTQSAVRKRMQRGTIPWDKDSEGRIYVYVDPSETSPGTGKDRVRDKAAGQSRDELLEAYREQVDFLRRELERKDTLLMSLMQRIPELEAPSEPRETSEKGPEEPGRGSVTPDEQQESSERPKRSWWREFFGLE
jgi:hypothetical protein